MKVLLLMCMTCIINLAFAQSSKLSTQMRLFGYIPVTVADSLISLSFVNQNAGTVNAIFNAKSNVNASGLLKLMDTTQELTPQQLYQYYMQKRKANNIIGFVLLGSGGIVAFIGLKNTVDRILAPGNGPAVFLTGSAIALLSIPFLIAGAKNKRRAYLSLKRAGAPATAINTGSLNYTAIFLNVQF